ncbi:unnamed protein product [Cochlearia groenlandica]
MENKGEPSLVPEWLRSSSAASNSNQLLVSSSSTTNSESASSQHHNNSWSRNSRSKSDVDSIHSPFLERSSSANSKRVSSNGSSKNAYSSFNFNRSQRDKDRTRDKDRVNIVYPWELDVSTSPGNILISREHDPLRRSHSMVTRKQGDHLSRVGLKNGIGGGSTSNSYNGNGKLSATSFQRSGFDKDFPTLGAEEKHFGHEVLRVSTPCLSSAVQSLPVGKSALIGGEGWRSALAEVPNAIDKACVGSLTSPKANAVSTGTLTGTTGLNMAEALVHAPARTQTPPQGYVNTQRLEDLAIKQSRQLIPVVPSAPKSSILNSSDKSKTKQAVRAGETCVGPSRNAQQQPSVHQSNNGQIKSEKKLLVLKPARENGAAVVKESGSPNSRPASSQLMNAAQSTQSGPVRSTNSPKEHKGAQTQSRNAFFSALKQKTTSTNISKEVVASGASSSQGTSGVGMTEKMEISSQVEEKNTIGFEAAEMPDEEEAQFLRSLGWDENCGEYEAITEQEIRDFYEQYKMLRKDVA